MWVVLSCWGEATGSRNSWKEMEGEDGGDSGGGRMEEGRKPGGGYRCRERSKVGIGVGRD